MASGSRVSALAAPEEVPKAAAKVTVAATPASTGNERASVTIGGRGGVDAGKAEMGEEYEQRRPMLTFKAARAAAKAKSNVAADTKCTRG